MSKSVCLLNIWEAGLKEIKESKNKRNPLWDFPSKTDPPLAARDDRCYSCDIAFVLALNRRAFGESFVGGIILPTIVDSSSAKPRGDKKARKHHFFDTWAFPLSFGDVGFFQGFQECRLLLVDSFGTAPGSPLRVQAVSGDPDCRRCLHVVEKAAG